MAEISCEYSRSRASFRIPHIRCCVVKADVRWVFYLSALLGLLQLLAYVSVLVLRLHWWASLNGQHSSFLCQSFSIHRKHATTLQHTTHQNLHAKINLTHGPAVPPAAANTHTHKLMPTTGGGILSTCIMSIIEGCSHDLFIMW